MPDSGSESETVTPTPGPLQVRMNSEAAASTGMLEPRTAAARDSGSESDSVRQLGHRRRGPGSRGPLRLRLTRKTRNRYSRASLRVRLLKVSGRPGADSERRRASAMCHTDQGPGRCHRDRDRDWHLVFNLNRAIRVTATPNAPGSAGGPACRRQGLAQWGQPARATQARACECAVPGASPRGPGPRHIRVAAAASRAPNHHRRART